VPIPLGHFTGWAWPAMEPRLMLAIILLSAAVVLIAGGLCWLVPTTGAID
jgi:hypothetical protein